MNYKINSTEYVKNKTSEGKDATVCIIKATLKFDYPENPKTDEIVDAIVNAECSSKGHVQNVFVGVAVLNEDDKYDEETGKRVAESKAKLKMFKTLLNLNKKTEDTLTRLVRATQEKQAFVSYWIAKEEIHYNQLTK